MEEVRGWALKVLGTMSSLSRSERSRVLKHALKATKV
jgi:hypothetical protein